MPDFSSRVPDRGCLSLAYAVQSEVYAGSGWSVMRAEVDQKPQQNAVTQAVVLFTSPQDAGSLHTASTKSWMACSQRQFTIAMNGTSTGAHRGARDQHERHPERHDHARRRPGVLRAGADAGEQRRDRHRHLRRPPRAPPSTSPTRSQRRRPRAGRLRRPQVTLYLPAYQRLELRNVNAIFIEEVSYDLYIFVIDPFIYRFAAVATGCDDRSFETASELGIFPM